MSKAWSTAFNTPRSRPSPNHTTWGRTNAPQLGWSHLQVNQKYDFWLSYSCYPSGLINLMLHPNNILMKWNRDVCMVKFSVNSIFWRLEMTIVLYAFSFTPNSKLILNPQKGFVTNLVDHLNSFLYLGKSSSGILASWASGSGALDLITPKKLIKKVEIKWYNYYVTGQNWSQGYFDFPVSFVF